MSEHAPSLRKSRWLRRTAIALGGLLSVAVLLLVAIRLIAMTSFGHGIAERQIEALNVSGLSFEIDDIDGDLFGEFSVGSLTVSDADGVWVRARDVSASWVPTSLLRRRINIHVVNAENIDVLRQPVLAASTPSESSGKDMWLRRVTVGDLSIGQLGVSDQILPEASQFQIAAKLDTDIRTGELGLNIRPNTSTGDKAEGSLVWGRELPLQGAINASGPVDGLFHQILQLNTESAVSIQVSGSGAPENWKLSAALKSGDQTAMLLDAAGAHISGSASGTIDLSLFEPAREISSRFGAQTSFNTQIVNAGSDAMRLDVDLKTDSLSASASAPFDPEGRAPDLTQVSVTATSTNPNMLMQTDSVSADRFEANGMLSYIDGIIRFTGDSRANGTSVAGFKVKSANGPATVIFSTDEQTLTIDANLRSSGVSYPDPILADYFTNAPGIKASVIVDLDEKKVSIPSALISSPGSRATGVGNVNFDASKLTFRGRAELAGRGETPSLNAAIWSVTRTGERPYKIAVAGDLTKVPLPDFITVSGGSPIHVDLQGSVTERGELTLTDGSLQSDDFTAKADGLLAGGTLKTSATGTLNTVTLGGVVLRSVQLTASASGPIDTLSFDVQARPDTVEFGDTPITLETARLTGERSANGISGIASLAGEIAGNEFALAGQPAVSGANWSVTQLYGNFDQLLVSGDVGGVGGDLDTITGNLEVEGSFALASSRAAIDGFVALENQTVNTDLHVQGLSVGSLQLEDATIKASGTRKGARGELTLIGALDLGGAGRQFDLTSPVTLDIENRSLQIAPAGKIHGTSIETLDAILLQDANGQQQATGSLTWLGGVIGLDARRSENDLTASLRLRDLSIREIGRAFERPGLRGIVSLEADLTGQGVALSGTSKLVMTDFSSGPPGTPKANIEINGTLENGALVLTGNALDESDALAIDLSGRIPVNASASPLQFSPQLEARSQLSLQSNGPVESLWSLLGPPETRLEGLFDISAQLDGPLATARPTGHFDLRSAEFEDGTVGLRLKEIALSADLSEDAVTIESFSAKGGRGGELSGSGRYAYDGAGSVDVKVSRLDAVQREDLSAVVSGTLAVSRENHATKINGDLNVERADIDVDRLPRGGYTTLDVVFPDRQNGNGDDDKIEEVVRLNIALKSDRRIYVKGSGLDSEWGLDAAITGSASAPKIEGEAFVVRGDVDLAGRKFRFADSSIRFAGDPSDARLNIRAERSSADLTAGVVLTGTAQSPKFALTSDPDLPEDEVLSRVLFGRSPSQLSALEAAQLASAFTSLSGGQSFDFTGSLQKALGVDRLDFGLTESGAASVGAGKYLAEDIYVEVNSSVRGAPGVSVEWTPRTNVEIGTDIETESAPRFTIKWKRDFDFRKNENDDKTPETVEKFP